MRLRAHITALETQSPPERRNTALGLLVFTARTYRICF
jgi:hypothetical protein